jgi:hypothetical protein
MNMTKAQAQALVDETLDMGPAEHIRRAGLALVQGTELLSAGTASQAFLVTVSVAHSNLAIAKLALNDFRKRVDQELGTEPQASCGS